MVRSIINSSSPAHHHHPSPRREGPCVAALHLPPASSIENPLISCPPPPPIRAFCWLSPCMVLEPGAPATDLNELLRALAPAELVVARAFSSTRTPYRVLFLTYRAPPLPHAPLLRS